MKQIFVITGDGKAKSTSAFGTVFRAAGHGMDVSIIQFVREAICNSTAYKHRTGRVFPRFK